MVANFQDYPFARGFAILNTLAIANIPRAIHKGLPFRAFVSSCCAIAALILMFGMGVYPNMIVSSTNPAYNLTIYNAALSQRTLFTMLIVAITGLPFVATYTASIYWGLPRQSED